MNAVIQTILNRRSCRSFTGEPVAEEDVRTLLLCAAAAPSGRNRQLGQFTALTDRNKIQKLAAAVGTGNSVNLPLSPTATKFKSWQPLSGRPSTGKITICTTPPR